MSLGSWDGGPVVDADRLAAEVAPFWAVEVGAGVGALPKILLPAVVVDGAVPDDAVVVAGAVLVVVTDGAEVAERLGNKPGALVPDAATGAVVLGVPLLNRDFVCVGAAAAVVEGVVDPSPPKSAGFDVA